MITLMRALAWLTLLLLLAAIWSPLGAWWQWLASALLAFAIYATADHKRTKP